MFKNSVKAVLEKAPLTAKGNARIAKCLFRIPIDYTLAQEVAPEVADRLYRLSSKHEFTPCLEIGYLGFEDILIPDQILEFRSDREAPTPDGVMTETEISEIHGGRDMIRNEMMLGITLTIRFPAEQSAVAAELLIKLLNQSCWLTFRPAQRKFDEDRDQSIGEFMNERNRATEKAGPPLVEFRRS